ncbi:MAG: cytochrome c maturation protein CcmE [Acidobacteriota bacterium]|nr:cytochrome c maturation protein CcmE [Acidobacteriota bacterium]
MDPNRKRAIRLTVAVSAALLLASALIYVSFNTGRDELDVPQLLAKAKPGGQYILAGTVENGSIRRSGNVTDFSLLSRDRRVAVAVAYTGAVPDPFAQGRAVMVTVTDRAGRFVGQPNSLTTKCPSKYQAASGALRNTAGVPAGPAVVSS